MKKKEFDAVEMMRKIRDELSETYSKDPAREEDELKEIRKKYGIKDKTRST